MRFFRTLALIVALTVLFTACASPTPSPAPLPTSTAAVPQVTRTPQPTETPLPTHTPTITQSPVPSPTPTITPDAALTAVKLIGMAWYSDYDMLISFEFPSPVNPQDYRVTLEEKEYVCEVIAKHPNQLYCRGPGAKVLAVAMVRLYAAGNPQPGFEKEIWIPFFDNNYNSFNQ